MNRIKKFLKRFWIAFWRQEMLVLPGQIAFFLFLSLVPTITLIGYACNYLKLSNTFTQVFLNNSIGKSYSSMLTPIITSTSITPTFFITLAVGYFIASQGMSSIIVASNTIYNIEDSGFFKRRLKAIIMEIIIVVLLLFVLIIPLLGNDIIIVLEKYSKWNNALENFKSVVKIFSGPLSWIVVFFFIKLLYTISPDKKIPSRSVNGGAIFTTISWFLITLLYSFYISNYANYSVFYGTLANIVILLVWIYFLSYAFVVGMAMNHYEQMEKTSNIELVNIEQKEEPNDKVLEKKETKTKKTTKKKNK